MSVMTGLPTRPPDSLRAGPVPARAPLLWGGWTKLARTKAVLACEQR